MNNVRAALASGNLKGLYYHSRVQASQAVFGHPIKEKGEHAPHGTHARYTKGPCDCVPCMMAEADYRSERRGLAIRLDVLCEHGTRVRMTPEEVRAGVMPLCAECRRTVAA